MGWLDKLQDGAKFDGLTNKGFNKNGAWGGQFQSGGNMNYYKAGLDFEPKTISQDGSIVKDDMGYWNPDNWGQPVEINSNDITMENVYQPLLGIGKQSGEKKLMKPGKKYNFTKDKQVTEYPISQNGREFKQLLDFSNIPDKKWLDNL